MNKMNDKELKFELNASCVNRGCRSAIDVSVNGTITPINKLMIIAQIFDAMVKIDTKHDRVMIAGLLYKAALSGTPTAKYFKELLDRVG